MRILLVALPLFLLACEVRTENSTSRTNIIDSQTTESDVVETRLKEYYERMSERNWKAYEKYFWNGATVTTAWKQPGDTVSTVDVTTIGDFLKETALGPDSQPVFEEKMLNSKITVEKNLCTAWVEYEAKFGKPDSLQQWKGTDVFTLLKHNGEWRIVSLVFESY